MAGNRADEAEWYFAYGANMSPLALRRRRVSPMASAAAVLSDYQLRFSHAGLFFLEPAFANLEVAPGASVHGVLHRIRNSELLLLDRLEGAEYQRIRVVVEGEGVGRVDAYAYLDPHPVQGRRPSRRYLNSLREGASSFALPASYCKELALQPSFHVPLLSDVATMLVRPAERLRYSGFRPERLRMARRERRRPDTSALLAEPLPWKEPGLPDAWCETPGHSAVGAKHQRLPQQALGGWVSNSFGTSLLERCASGLPLIPIEASHVTVETNLGPQGFHSKLRHLLRNARQRVVLASLYLGTGPYEQQLIRDLRHAIESSSELRVTVVVDHSRGLRPTANGDTTTMLASLLREYPERVELYLYKMPQLSGARVFLPSPLDECVAVSHFKSLVFDDTAIVTGANLSEEYFTCRQARFVAVDDPRFAEFSAQVVAATARASLQVRVGAGGMHMLPAREDHSSLVERVQTLVPASGGPTSADSTYWSPVFQHPALGLKQEEELLTQLLSWGTGELSIATPYPNFPEAYLRSLRTRLQGAGAGLTEIISPSDRSHSFTTGRGFKSIVPRVYLRREQAMHEALAQDIAKVTLRRYEKAGWVFHGKGIWLQTAQEIATVIGSSSFGARSVLRDYDLSCLLVTRDAVLRSAFAAELDFLRELSPSVDASARTAGILASILAPLARSYM